MKAGTITMKKKRMQLRSKRRERRKKNRKSDLEMIRGANDERERKRKK